MNEIENFLPINLPSKCLPYDGVKPEDVMVRAYQGKDEIFLAEINPINLEQKYLQVLKNVLRGVNPENLTLGDRYYIMVWEYAKSYSNDLVVKLKCTHCLKDVEAIINLGELNVVSLPDNFKQPCERILPVSGKKVMLRLFTVKDEIEANKYEEHNDDGLLYRCARMMVSNDDILQRIDELKGMAAKDVAAIRAFQHEFDHGPDMNTTFKCPSCGEVDNIKVPFRFEDIFPDGEALTSIIGKRI